VQSTRRVLAIVVWLAAVQATLAASSQSPPACGFAPGATAGRGFVTTQNALEERLFLDAAAGRLHAFSPIEAAFVAGGVQDDDSLRQYVEKAAALVDELRRSGTLAGTPRQQVEAIFAFMHRRILRGGYELGCTDLRRVLDEGRFNCISASVLFNYLAGQFGLDCRGLEMPGHAMSRVVLSDGPLDVETTCPQWFSVYSTQPRPIVTRSVSEAASGFLASASGYDPREVTPIQMAAMIYYNRGVDLLNEKRFAEAAAANAKALRLDPRNATARGNLLATVNNWSIELGNAERFAEAVDLLRQGLALDAKFEAFAQNYVHVHRQWAEHLCQSGRFEEAMAILSRAAAEMPDRDYLRQAQGEVRQRWAKTISVSASSPSGLPLPLPCVDNAAKVD
jgi:tetratricopeptide (TPR) repeat protein